MRVYQLIAVDGWDGDETIGYYATDARARAEAYDRIIMDYQVIAHEVIE